jgi:hypothetical protein
MSAKQVKANSIALMSGKHLLEDANKNSQSKTPAVVEDAAVDTGKACGLSISRALANAAAVSAAVCPTSDKSLFAYCAGRSFVQEMWGTEVGREFMDAAKRLWNDLEMVAANKTPVASGF